MVTDTESEAGLKETVQEKIEQGDRTARDVLNELAREKEQSPAQVLKDLAQEDETLARRCIEQEAERARQSLSTVQDLIDTWKEGNKKADAHYGVIGHNVGIEASRTKAERLTYWNEYIKRALQEDSPFRDELPGTYFENTQEVPNKLNPSDSAEEGVPAVMDVYREAGQKLDSDERAEVVWNLIANRHQYTEEDTLNKDEPQDVMMALVSVATTKMGRDPDSLLRDTVGRMYMDGDSYETLQRDINYELLVKTINKQLSSLQSDVNDQTEDRDVEGRSDLKSFCEDALSEIDEAQGIDRFQHSRQVNTLFN